MYAFLSFNEIHNIKLNCEFDRCVCVNDQFGLHTSRRISNSESKCLVSRQYYAIVVRFESREIFCTQIKSFANVNVSMTEFESHREQRYGLNITHSPYKFIFEYS